MGACSADQGRNAHIVQRSNPHFLDNESAAFKSTAIYKKKQLVHHRQKINNWHTHINDLFRPPIGPMPRYPFAPRRIVITTATLLQGEMGRRRIQYVPSEDPSHPGLRRRRKPCKKKKSGLVGPVTGGMPLAPMSWVHADPPVPPAHRLRQCSINRVRNLAPLILKQRLRQKD
eukprot:gene3617-2554_t